MLAVIQRRKSDTASSKVRLALRALERHYRPDQPRAPSGRPDGGQWISTGGTASRRRTAQGRVTFSGPLIKQNYVSATGALECTYYDRGHDYRFTVTYVGYSDCPQIYIRY